MPSTALSNAVTAVRAVLIIAGFGVAAATAGRLASMPPPPPGSDGFAHGMAAIVGSVIIVAALGVATFCAVLPATLDRPDPFGFGRRQRTALKGAAGLVAVGLVLGVAYGLVSIPPLGVILWLAFVVLAAVVVAVTLGWRLVEAGVSRIGSSG